MNALKAVCIIGLLSSLGGCSNSEPRYQVSEGSIAAYMNPAQSQPTTVMVDRQTAQTWYLVRTATGEVTWLALGEPMALKK
ncbi:MAG: hypothetical protein EOS52_07250 [Mesorhizobium sp.]|uniref:hypothetical protein n=1 Tax=Mesorhizobium sp. TaxID=1871066 RepID=UPI000FE7C1AC|nr:hypothetical protein [Mesorhizobium sp.]RWC15941.1 MAG: hypothetical protein EOS52_07250 [Mesorhizobium sp.]